MLNQINTSGGVAIFGINNKTENKKALKIKTSLLFDSLTKPFSW